MAKNGFKLYEICKICEGTGIETIPLGAVPTPTPVPCPLCGGLKYVEWGWITEETSEGMKKLFPTYRILESTDPTEYVGLAPGNVALYNLIISAGIIDLSATTLAWAVLMAAWRLDCVES